MEVGLSVAAAARGARWMRTRGALAAWYDPWSAEGVAVLNHFIRSIAEHRAFDQPDPVGAYPIHALSARMPYEAAWT